MKILSALFLVAFLMFLSSGCAHSGYDFRSLLGVNIKDLETVKANEIEKTFSLSYPELFDTVKSILAQNNLTIYQSNTEKRYIIAMGFNKQVDTTRVGIFFEPVTATETTIKLNSLSNTAIKKADAIIFGNLPQ